MKNKEFLYSLSKDIVENSVFIQDYNDLMWNFLKKAKNLQEDRIKRLIESSCIFSLCDDDDFRYLAQNIMIFLMEIDTDYPHVKLLSEIVFFRLGNLPAIEFLKNSNEDLVTLDIDDKDYNDLKLLLSFPEMLSKQVVNRIEIGQNEFFLTDFQTKVFNILMKNTHLSFSGPTSAGKSFIILLYIAYRLFHNPNYTVIYIVPTRALQSEVQRDLRKLIREMNLDLQYNVTTSINSINTSYLESSHSVVIFTQERLQESLSQNLDIKPDLFIIDEAQKIMDERGIILEEASKELIETYRPQTIFISPNVDNPGKFKDIFEISNNFQEIKTTYPPVSQVIYLINFSLSEKKVYVAIFDNKIKLNNVSLTVPIQINSIRTQVKRKIWVLNNLIAVDEPTLIYCNSPSQCRITCKHLLELYSSSNRTSNLRSITDFLKELVHEDYYLINYLGSGIGFHYGNMPQFIRYIVKQLFEMKEITILCCTSTLLEGINLPAKNLILLKPLVGDQIDKLSLMNLVGRTGRLKKDFFGKIFFIDVDEWQLEEQDILDNKLVDIQPITDSIIEKEKSILLKYLENYKTELEINKSIKTLATSLLVRTFKNNSADFIYSYKKRDLDISNDEIDTLKQLLEKEVDRMMVIREIVLRNRSIDPRYQFELYNSLLEEESLVLPPFPIPSGFYKNLRKIFYYISYHLFRDTTRKFEYFTWLADKWINQYSFKEILNLQLDRKKIMQIEDDNKRKSKINSTIDDLEDAIENGLRYNYVKGLKCYIDMIDLVSRSRNLTERYCEGLAMFLEFGCKENHILLLINAGLSRHTALYIKPFLSNVELWATINDARSWLKNSKESLQPIVPEIMFREIETVLG